MFKDNLTQLRKMRRMTQEDVAEKLCVTRQAVAKWEAGETVPDLDKCRLLAELFEVSLDDLANLCPVFCLPSRPAHGRSNLDQVSIGIIEADDFLSPAVCHQAVYILYLRITAFQFLY